MRDSSLSIPAARQPSISMARVGVALSALTVLFLIFDGVIKMMTLAPVVESFAGLGFPVWLAFPIGLVELVCVALYVVPRTSALGATLLTGFLGGATAAKVRLEDPWFLFAVGVGVLVWTGLFLRDGPLRAVVAVRR